MTNKINKKNTKEEYTFKDVPTIEDIGNLLNALAGESRNVPVIIDRTDVETVTISTVDTLDMGLETAIIANGDVIPVERYKTIELAKEGHKKWVKFITDGNKEITELSYGPLKSRKVILDY